MNVILLREIHVIYLLKDVLKSICKTGLPVGNIYEYAAQQVLNYEKKYKRKSAVKIGNKGFIYIFYGF